MYNAQLSVCRSFGDRMPRRKRHEHMLMPFILHINIYVWLYVKFIRATVYTFNSYDHIYKLRFVMLRSQECNLSAFARQRSSTIGRVR